MQLDLNEESLGDFNEKIHRTGVVYISHVPRSMTPSLLRNYLSPFGELGRIFLTPLIPIISGKKGTGKFKDGWVEFKNKKHAKMAVLALNGTIMGGKKSSRFYDEIWTIKYLSGVKWNELSEKKTYSRTIKDHQIRTEIANVRRENNTYVKHVHQANRMERVSAREESPKNESVKLDSLKKYFGQRKPLNKFE